MCWRILKKYLLHSSKPSLKVMILAGGLTSTSSCIFYAKAYNISYISVICIPTPFLILTYPQKQTTPLKLMLSMCASFITRSRKSQEVDNRGNPTTTKKEKKKNGLDCGKPVNYTQFDSLRGISNRKSHPHIPEPEVAMIFKKKGSRNAEVDMSDLEKKLKKSKKEVRIYSVFCLLLYLRVYR